MEKRVEEREDGKRVEEREDGIGQFNTRNMRWGKNNCNFLPERKKSC